MNDLIHHLGWAVALAIAVYNSYQWKRTANEWQETCERWASWARSTNYGASHLEKYRKSESPTDINAK